MPTPIFLTSGLDRGDGLNGRMGTATPASAIRVSSAGATGDATKLSAITIEEQPDSPEIERAEQATLRHSYRGPWDEMVTRLMTLGRGVIEIDGSGNWTRVLSARLRFEKPGIGLLEKVSEGLSFDSPPDEFQITPVELGLNILKHPRYFYAMIGPDGVGSLLEQKNAMVIRLLQDYFENPSAAFRIATEKLIYKSIATANGGPAGSTGTVDGAGSQQPPKWNGSSYPTNALVAGTDFAKRAALEIITKYWKGIETPYVVGYMITWSAYYFRPPEINPGGYVEDPMIDASPQLPDYFFSTAYPPDASKTIFDGLTHKNPQCYSQNGLKGGPLDISWLRKSDEIDYQRTWFKIHRTWIGSPVGFWDPQLYSADKRPQVPSDFIELRPEVTS